MGNIYSLPGQPSNYIQVDEVGLKNCLDSVGPNDAHSFNNCINQFIVAPANNTQVGVNPWHGKNLPPNPSCSTKNNLSPTYNLPFGGNMNNQSLSNFQNLENNLTSSGFLNQNNLTLIIIVIITLLIVKYE